MMKNIWIHVLSALMICSCAFATSLSGEQKLELSRRIKSGDREAMLEAGNTGDTSFAPKLEWFIQTEMGGLSNQLAKLEENNHKMGWSSGFPVQAELAGHYRDPRIQAAQMALAELGVNKYLDEIIYELVGTNSPAFKAAKRGSMGMLSAAAPDYHTRSAALQKLAYIGNPATVKFIGPVLYETSDPYPRAPETRDVVVYTGLATYASDALSKIITNGPTTGGVNAWQKWWEQNKDKYP
jgi:hypothetical protein